MNLFSDFSSAFHNATNRFLGNKNEEVFYIFSCKVNRREFYCVFSEKEAKKYKVSVKKAAFIVGESDRSKEIRNEVQERINSPEVKKHDAYVSYLRASQRLYKAEKKVDEINQ